MTYKYDAYQTVNITIVETHSDCYRLAFNGRASRDDRGYSLSNAIKQAQALDGKEMGAWQGSTWVKQTYKYQFFPPSGPGFKS